MPVSEGSSLFDWNKSDSYSSPRSPWPLLTVPFLEVRIHGTQRCQCCQWLGLTLLNYLPAAIYTLAWINSDFPVVKQGLQEWGTVLAKQLKSSVTVLFRRLESHRGACGLGMIAVVRDIYCFLRDKNILLIQYWSKNTTAWFPKSFVDDSVLQKLFIE